MVRYGILFLMTCLFMFSCKSGKEPVNTTKDEIKPVVIANDSLEYEIIIIDQGFDTYLNSIAKPKWYYSESYYRTKNILYVTEWNIRARQPMRYSPNLYEQAINYDGNIDYGLEVNYKLFNYFKFVEYKYKVRFF